MIDPTQADALSRLPLWSALTIFPVGEDKLPRIRWGEVPPGGKILDPETDSAFGIATGTKSGGIVVLDLDTKPGRDGLSWARSLATPLPATFTVRTPSGGLHFYFLSPLAPVPNSSDKIAPGVDIRGEGGFVVGPGSVTPRGVYTVAIDAPIAPLPPWLRDLAGAARPARTLQDIPRDPSTPAPSMTDLQEVTSGRRGVEWDAWRDVARGARFVRVRGGLHGPERAPQGVDTLLRDMTHALAVVRPDWQGVDVEALASASMSILRADDTEAGNPTYAPGALADKFDRAAQKARSDRAATAALEAAVARAVAEVEEGQGPKIVQFRRSYYLADPVHGYAGPFLDSEVWAAARDRGTFPVMVPQGKGERRANPADFMEAFGRGGHVVDVALDFCATRAHLEQTPAGPRLVRPAAPRPPIVPEFRAEIAAWLHLLGGGLLLDWISVATDLSEACPALWFTGAPGTGKTLLARGLAGLFGQSEPVSLEHALSRFNDALEHCPIILGDEKIPTDNRGIPLLEEFKSLVSDTSRRLEPKGLPLVTLRGAVRVILATNNVAAIRASKDLTQEDAEALSARLIHLRRDGAEAAQIQALLAAQPVQREWIDGGALCRHLAWVIQNHPSPARGPRFRLPALAGEIRDALLTQPGAGWDVCRLVYEWILQSAKAVRSGGSALTSPLWIEAGGILGTTSGIAKRLEDSDVSQRGLGQAIARVAEKTDSYTSGARVRAWRFSPEKIRQWAETSGWGDARDLTEALGVLQVKP